MPEGTTWLASDSDMQGYMCATIQDAMKRRECAQSSASGCPSLQLWNSETQDSQAPLNLLRISRKNVHLSELMFMPSNHLTAPP